MTSPTTRQRSAGQAVPVTLAASDPIQMPSPRHVVHLDANAVGILEQHRVVARREAVLLRRVDDLRAQLLGDEAMRLVDVAALAGAEAEVVEADLVLVEARAAPLGRRLAHEHAGAA